MSNREEPLIDAADPIERHRQAIRAIGHTARPGELLRQWRHGPFRLVIFDTLTSDARGRSLIAYRLFDSRFPGGAVFEAADFFASPSDAIDSDETLASLLTFLSLRPGDAGEDYFAGYSQRQAEWMELYAEELALLATELKDAVSRSSSPRPSLDSDRPPRSLTKRERRERR